MKLDQRDYARIDALAESWLRGAPIDVPSDLEKKLSAIPGLRDSLDDLAKKIRSRMVVVR